MSPEEFENRMVAIMVMPDKEEIVPDGATDLLCDVLREQGFHGGVEIFERKENERRLNIDTEENEEIEALRFEISENEDRIEDQDDEINVLEEKVAELNKQLEAQDV